MARDGGESIRARVKATRDLTEWSTALELYAGMQMELATRLEEMRALGVPDRRPHTLPAQYGKLLEDTAILRIDLPKGLTREEFARLQELAGPLTEWCGQAGGGQDSELAAPRRPHQRECFEAGWQVPVCGLGRLLAGAPIFVPANGVGECGNCFGFAGE